VTRTSNNDSPNLLSPLPESRLNSWLEEFYGKSVEIDGREVLQHRDFSYVERLSFKDALPESLIYKLVLPPWDIEQDLHECILIPSIASSAQLFMSAHYGRTTAMFLEDLGSKYLRDSVSEKAARQLGEEIAKMHRAYSYRIDELIGMNVLRSVTPIDFDKNTAEVGQALAGWGCLKDGQLNLLKEISTCIAQQLAGEPITLVHGDLYAENIVCGARRHFIVDWSWFTLISVPLVDVVTLTADLEKNGDLREYADELLDSYCFEYGRKCEDVRQLLPAARVLERLFFLMWLVERRRVLVERNGGLDGGDGEIESVVSEILALAEQVPA